MSPVEIVEAVQAVGGVWVPEGDRIRYQLPEQAVPLLDEPRGHKPDVLDLLGRRTFAHLLPFLGKRVWTSEGPGKLVAVEDYATVEFARQENALV